MRKMVSNTSANAFLLLTPAMWVSLITLWTFTVTAGEVHDAAIKGDTNTLAALLLAYPTKVNEQDSDGNTPLHLAVRANSKETVEVALQFKPNLELVNKSRMTALKLAKGYGRTELVALIEHATNSGTPSEHLPSSQDARLTPIRESANSFSRKDGQLLVGEAFTNYTVGLLPGQAFTGTGFAAGGSWAGLDEHFQEGVVDAASVTTNGMSCLLVAGGVGRVTLKGNNSHLRAFLDTSTNGPFAAAGLCNPETGRIGGGSVSGTLYISFLFRALSEKPPK